MILSTLFLAALALPPQQPPRQAAADFHVRFDGPAAPIPAGLGRGINDLSNASAGCWEAFGEHVRPEGGLARIWLSYAIGPLSKQIEAGLHARDAGMEVYLVAVGAPENLGKGHGAAGTGIPPKDAVAWADAVARDVRTLRQAGVPVSYVEVWNEPDFPGQWNGTEESFAAFFARAGGRLKSKLPDLRVGGPGMAGPAGKPLDFFRKILQACKQAAWSPDFLSYHYYGGYASDNQSREFGLRLERMAKEAGLARPELILSEWNVGLPHPVRPELDDHRAGVYFAAMNSSLAYTPVSHSLFFFLQDGYWEAKQDYAGESVGLFTLRGGPKAVLNGMRMFRQAAELPLVPVEREIAPWNLTCLATRDGGRGYLLLTNSTGDAVKRARHYADWAGIDMSNYAGKERQLQAWATGRISYERMGGRAEDRATWEEARRLLGETRDEAAKTERMVRLRFSDPPAGVERVWRLDGEVGDPATDDEFRARFDQLVASLPERASLQALASFRDEGLPEDQLAVLEDAYAEPDQEAVRRGLEARRGRLGPALVRQAGERYRDQFLELRGRIPVQLAGLPAAAMAKVPPGRFLRRVGEELEVELPTWSAILIEVRWEEPASGDQG